jgi:hypothetical protein
VSDSLEELRQELRDVKAKMSEFTTTGAEQERAAEARLAEGLRAQLNRSRSRWYSTDEGTDDAA